MQESTRLHTAQKMKFSVKDFFSKCDQIRRKLRIWSHLLKKSLMENFIFSAVVPNNPPNIRVTEDYLSSLKRVVPENRSCTSSTRNGKKIFGINGSQMKRIKRNDFNNKLKHRRVFYVPLVGQMQRDYMIV